MVREQRKKRQNGQNGDKRFEGEGWAKVLHWQRGGPGKTVEVYRLEKSEGGVTVLQ